MRLDAAKSVRDQLDQLEIAASTLRDDITI